MKKTAILVFAIPFLLAAPAHARDSARPGAAKGAAVGETTYRTQTRYDFDDDLVEGELVSPEEALVRVRKAPIHPSLLKPRQNFISEMVKSAEEL